ncbi:MAG: class I SAM-dependent methyltransferase [Proteobacteria bacterium]|nr:class I SAM-dependent methyltransferase [Pseudomonadota bacterium]
MAWSDLFSNFYDQSLEPLYREQRVLAADALAVRPGHSILDLPCGTGQSFPALADRMDGGVLVGADLSAGMLRRAQQRADALDAEIRTAVGDATAVDADWLEATAGRREVDRLHVFLGMSAFPSWQTTFGQLWALLAPGGRCVVVDVYAETLGVQGHMVNLVAQADIRRRGWEPLEAVAEQFERRDLPSLPAHGGTMWLATGTKPAA